MPKQPEDLDDDQLTGWSAMCDEIAEEREAHDQQLRLTWGQEDDFDPLLAEISQSRRAMLQAEARLRRLIAYGREFTRPRPYRLEDLARAAGVAGVGNEVQESQLERGTTVHSGKI